MLLMNEVGASQLAEACTIDGSLIVDINSANWRIVVETSAGFSSTFKLVPENYVS